MLFQPGKKIGIAQQSIFDDFGVTAQQLASGQGGEHRDVRYHDARLIEQPDEILALGHVDCRFAADRGIHLGEQGCRHLREIDAALQRSSGETGNISDHATAQCDDQRPAFHIGRE